MRKIPVRLAIAAICFALGVFASQIYRFASEIYRFYSLPEVTALEEPPPSYLPIESSCFPGLSIDIKYAPAKAFFGGVDLSGTGWSDRYIVEWYSEALKAMGEDKLISSSNEEESYRFLWLRSFHEPIAVRVRRIGSHRLVVVKEMERSGVSESCRKSVKTTAFLISEEEWNQFMLNLERACFWRMPTPDEKILMDGAEWIMEGYREGRYHVVDRQSPDEGPYRDACLYLLRVSHVLGRIPQREVY